MTEKRKKSKSRSQAAVSQATANLEGGTQISASHDQAKQQIIRLCQIIWKDAASKSKNPAQVTIIISTEPYFVRLSIRKPPQFLPDER